MQAGCNEGVNEGDKVRELGGPEIDKERSEEERVRRKPPLTAHERRGEQVHPREVADHDGEELHRKAIEGRRAHERDNSEPGI